MITHLDRYLLKHITVPLFSTLGVAALLLLLERMLRLFDFVVNQGGPVEVVFRMLGSLVPHYLGLALPVGLLLGILLAFRKLSLNSELDAITSSGTTFSRLMRPVLALSLLLMVANYFLVGFLQPYSRYTYRNLVFDLRSGALGASVHVGEFVDIGNNIVMRIEESRQNGAQLIGIFLERSSPDGRQIAVTAKTGGFFSTNNQQNVYLRLYDGKLIDLTENEQKPRVLSFDVQDIAVKLPTTEVFRRRGGEHLELTITELANLLTTPGEPAFDRNSYQADLNWRLIASMTFLVIPFLAVALGITNKRSGQSTGIIVALAILILYNETLEVGQSLVEAGTASPLISMWSLFLALTLISARFYYVRAYVVGGEPLKWVDMLWAQFNRPLRKIRDRVEEALT